VPYLVEDYNGSMPKEEILIKEIRFDGKFLYLRRQSKEECLGGIRTMRGLLTHAQKLAAVNNANRWVIIRGNTIDRKSLND
jgi:hypothetical protein